jgi:hypothetical protein
LKNILTKNNRRRQKTTTRRYITYFYTFRSHCFYTIRI